MLAAHPDKVRLVYKSYTLPFHVHGEPAARAAFAAGQQGKFWEMEHLLFERQAAPRGRPTSSATRRSSGSTSPKWKADMESPAVKDRIAHDHKLGEELKLKGTPTIYVNGRELDVEADESLEERVAARARAFRRAPVARPPGAIRAAAGAPVARRGDSKPR